MSKQRGDIVVIVLILVILGLFGASGFMFYKQRTSKEQKGSDINKNISNIIIDQKNEDNKTLSETKISETKTMNTDILDCKEDYNCLIDAVKKGLSARTRQTFVSWWLGSVPVTSLIETRSQDRFGDYTYFSRIESTGDKVSEEELQEAISSGMSKEEIDQKAKEAIQAIKAIIGTETLCKYNNRETMASLLAKKANGEFSLDDLSFAKCKTKMSEEKGTLLDNFDCVLTPGPFLNSYPLGTLISTNQDVKGFRGNAEKVSWIIKDRTIASISSSVGEKVKITPLSPGETELIIVDNAVGPNCKVVVPIKVIR